MVCANISRRWKFWHCLSASSRLLLCSAMFAGKCIDRNSILNNNKAIVEKGRMRRQKAGATTTEQYTCFNFSQTRYISGLCNFSILNFGKGNKIWIEERRRIVIMAALYSYKVLNWCLICLRCKKNFYIQGVN